MDNTEKKKIIAEKYGEIMEVLGLDLKDESLKGTPNRVAKMYVDEIFSGLDNKNFPRVMTVPNGNGETVNYNQMLIVDNLKVSSNCIPTSVWLKTKNGRKRAREVRVGDELRTIKDGFPELTKILEISSKVSDNIYEIRFQHGKKIQVTGDHPIATAHGFWVEAQHLKRLDKCFFIDQKHYRIISKNGNLAKQSTTKYKVENTSVNKKWEAEHGFPEKFEMELGACELLKVLGVKKEKGTRKVFSIKTETGTFVVGGVLTHNCEHHILPIDGVCHIAYIPGKKVLGLSKFARIVDFYCRRPQIQERLTEQIWTKLSEILETENIGVVIRARHFCMISRGVKDQQSETTTSKMGGAFLDSTTRKEFIDLIKK